MFKYMKMCKKNYYPHTISIKIFKPIINYCFLAIQMFVLAIGGVALKLFNNFNIFFISIIIIYLNVFLFSAIEYTIKSNHINRFNGRYGIYSELYLRKAKMAIILGIAMTIGIAGYLIRTSAIINFSFWQDYYWIWYSVIMFVGLGVRYIDIVNVYANENYISGNYIVPYSQITEMKIVDCKMSRRGEIYIVDLYKDNKVIGFDKIFAEDYKDLNEKFRLKSY